MLSGPAYQHWLVVAPSRNMVLDPVRPDPACILPGWSNPRQAENAQGMHKGVRS